MDNPVGLQPVAQGEPASVLGHPLLDINPTFTREEQDGFSGRSVEGERREALLSNVCASLDQHLTDEELADTTSDECSGGFGRVARALARENGARLTTPTDRHQSVDDRRDAKRARRPGSSVDGTRDTVRRYAKTGRGDQVQTVMLKKSRRTPSIPAPRGCSY